MQLLHAFISNSKLTYENMWTLILFNCEVSFIIHKIKLSKMSVSRIHDKAAFVQNIEKYENLT